MALVCQLLECVEHCGYGPERGILRDTKRLRHRIRLLEAYAPNIPGHFIRVALDHVDRALAVRSPDLLGQVR